MGHFNFNRSSCRSRKALKDIPWVRYDRTGRISASGRMSRKDILPALQMNELAARDLMERTNAEHVLYGLKIYNQYDELEAVQFYEWALDEERFQKCATKCRNGIVYALHRR